MRGCCRAGLEELTAWKRRRRSIRVVAAGEGRVGGRAPGGGCSIEGATGILFCPSENESGSYEWPTESAGGAAVQKRVGSRVEALT